MREKKLIKLHNNLNARQKKKKKNHQPSQTSDSLGKIFTTCHRERTNFVNTLKNAYQKKKKKKKAQLKMVKDTL